MRHIFFIKFIFKISSSFRLLPQNLYHIVSYHSASSVASILSDLSANYIIEAALFNVAISHRIESKSTENEGREIQASQFSTIFLTNAPTRLDLNSIPVCHSWFPIETPHLLTTTTKPEFIFPVPLLPLPK